MLTTNKTYVQRNRNICIKIGEEVLQKAACSSVRNETVWRHAKEAKIRTAISGDGSSGQRKGRLRHTSEVGNGLTCVDGILLVQVEVRVDVGVLVVMGSHVEHLQPG